MVIVVRFGLLRVQAVELQQGDIRVVVIAAFAELLEAPCDGAAGSPCKVPDGAGAAGGDRADPAAGGAAAGACASLASSSSYTVGIPQGSLSSTAVTPSRTLVTELLEVCDSPEYNEHPDNDERSDGKSYFSSLIRDDLFRESVSRLSNSLTERELFAVSERKPPAVNRTP